MRCRGNRSCRLATRLCSGSHIFCPRIGMCCTCEFCSLNFVLKPSDSTEPFYGVQQQLQKDFSLARRLLPLKPAKECICFWPLAVCLPPGGEALDLSERPLFPVESKTFHLLSMSTLSSVPCGMSCSILPHSLRKFGKVAGRIHTTKCSSLFRVVFISAPPLRAGTVW